MTKNGSGALDALLEEEDLNKPAVEDAGAAPKPPMPKTKAEVNKLNSDQLDMLVEAHGLAGQLQGSGPWFDLSTEEKRKVLSGHLGFTGGKKKTVAAITTAEDAATATAVGGAIITQEEVKAVIGTPVAPKDPLAAVASEIESLEDQDAIEAEITLLIKNEGMNEFRLGGLLLKLLEEGKFSGSAANFSDYVLEKWGLEYRSARNRIELYTGVLKSGVPWDTISHLGWTKVKALLPILTPENAAEWVAKAKEYNKETLKQAVKDALAGGTTTGSAPTQVNTLKTINFNVGPDQEELIKEALSDAMAKAKTEHKGVALELICTEYLGGYIKKAAEGAAPAMDPAKVYDPKTVFQHFLKLGNGDRAAALSLLFTDAFDEVFPNVEISMKVKG